MGLLSVFKQTFLKNPGDEMHACVKPDGKRILKVSMDNGSYKHSIVEYPSGRRVETKSYY